MIRNPSPGLPLGKMLMVIIETNGLLQKKYGNAEANAMAIEQQQRAIRSLPHYVEAPRLDVDGQ